LAIARCENGANFVLDLISTEECVISSVSVDVINFNQKQAILSAQMRPLTKAIGLSLGDRACIALTKSLDGCAVTAARAWLDIAGAVGVAIRFIR
jgi:ribonuclease VapC